LTGETAAPLMDPVRGGNRSPWMTDALMEFRASAREFCTAELAPRQRCWMAQQHVDRGLWARAGQAGLLCRSIPVEYGGGGGTFAHEVILLEEQARVNDSCWASSVHNGMVAHYLLAYGTEAQRRLWLPRLASGEMVGAIAITEPDAGSDLGSIRTRAVRDGADYVINGAKSFVTNGAQADLTVLAAVTGRTPGAYGLSLFLVEASRPGFSRGAIQDKLGLKGQDTAELFFDDVRVPAGQLLGGREGQATFQLMEQLAQERLIIAVTSVAAMEAAVRETVRAVRADAGFADDESQHARFAVAECATEAAVCRAFLDHCIEAHLRGGLDMATAAMVKWWCSDRACRVADACLQLKGAEGMTDLADERSIGRIWTDVRAHRIFGGTNEILKEIISQLV
jgi:acyl-CoA dehydrogenase